MERAIAHFELSPLADSAPHLRYLHENRDLGVDAPGWVWSRWVLQQAHRLLYLNRDERLHDALLVTVGSVYPEVDPERPRERDAKEFVAEVMAMDWMCRQLALYEFGGLATYLDTMAKPPLLKLADRIMAWPAATMAAFRIEEAARGEATLTDLATGDRRQALNLGWLAEGIGQCVVGRLVPMRCEPRWIFESRPREVSGAVAEEVARAGAQPVPRSCCSLPVGCLGHESSRPGGSNETFLVRENTDGKPAAAAGSGCHRGAGRVRPRPGAS